MIESFTIGLVSGTVACLIYIIVAGRVKANRLIQHGLRNLKCAFGAHSYIFNWNAPYFTQPARCTWCGHHGPWRRIP
jgi:hypothetical protein